MNYIRSVIKKQNRNNKIVWQSSKLTVLDACSSKTEEITYVRYVLNSYDEN